MSHLLSAPLPIPIRHQAWAELSQVAVHADAESPHAQGGGLTTLPLADGFSIAYDIDPASKTVTLRVVSVRKTAEAVAASP